MHSMAMGAERSLAGVHFGTRLTKHALTDAWRAATALAAVESELAVAVDPAAAQDAQLLLEVCSAAGEAALPTQFALSLALQDTAALSSAPWCKLHVAAPVEQPHACELCCLASQEAEAEYSVSNTASLLSSAP